MSLSSNGRVTAPGACRRTIPRIVFWILLSMRGMAIEDITLTELADPLVRRLEDRGLAVPGGIREAVEALLRTRDPGARVGSRDVMIALEADRAGRERGPGMDIDPGSPNFAIRRIVPGGPADEAGFLEGDLLDSLDGRYVAGRRFEEIRRSLQNPESESVHISVLRPRETRARKAVLIPRFLAPEPAILSEYWTRGMGYLRPGSLREGTAEALAAIRAEWKDRLQLGTILDLRGVGGDSLDQAVRLARALGVREMPKWEGVEAAPEEEVRNSVAGEPLFSGPVLLLVDARTRGAAEWLAAAVKGQPGLLLIGVRTAGDPLLREPVEIGPADWAWIKTRRLQFSGMREREPDDAVVPDLAAAESPSAAARAEWEEERRNGRDRRRTLAVEEQDRQLDERVSGDPVLRQAADVLLAMNALSGWPTLESEKEEP